MLPDLPEPEVTPPAEAAASKGMTELAESDEERGEEAEEEEAPPTIELTAAARAARAAVGAKKEDEPPEDETAGKTVDTEEPKPALPMQKSAPNWAQTSPVAEAEREGD